jgi:TRAP-type mannitol/chloroaromatic compound transport system permease large subunit
MQSVAQALPGRMALPSLLKAVRSPAFAATRSKVTQQLMVALLPLALLLIVGAMAWRSNTAPPMIETALPAGLERSGESSSGSRGGLAEPPSSTGGLAEPPSSKGGLAEPPSSTGGLAEPPGAATAGTTSSAGGLQAPPGSAEATPAATSAGGLREPGSATGSAKRSDASPTAPAARAPATTGYWVGLGVAALALLGFYALLSFERFEIFKMLLQSFFPLLVLILAVLGSIVFGLATPTEAAAVGAFGGYLLAAIYSVIGKQPAGKRVPIFLVWLLLWGPALAAVVWFILSRSGSAPTVPLGFGAIAALGVALWAVIALKQAQLHTAVKESVYLTAKTSAMVCWLFVGSAIFSAAFALLGGQELVERWVLSMNLSKTEFLILSQVIIFILGWPLEWTEIIVIFMPIFIPLLDKFGVDPLFFGLLVALNLQTAFLSPPVAMAAFYLKGVSPPHVTLNQIFAGMLPFMGIQLIAIVLLYQFPAIGLWLPQVLYK